MTSLIQHLPMAFLVAYSAAGLKGSAPTGTSNAASLEFQSEAEMPTENFPAYGVPAQDDASAGLAWIALGKQLLPEGRPLLDWERQDADEFFWSQFE
jgi:hypothetical protein